MSAAQEDPQTPAPDCEGQSAVDQFMRLLRWIRRAWISLAVLVCLLIVANAAQWRAIIGLRKELTEMTKREGANLQRENRLLDHVGIMSASVPDHETPLRVALGFLDLTTVSVFRPGKPTVVVHPLLFDRAKLCVTSRFWEMGFDDEW